MDGSVRFCFSRLRFVRFARPSAHLTFPHFSAISEAIGQRAGIVIFPHPPTDVKIPAQLAPPCGHQPHDYREKQPEIELSCPTPSPSASKRFQRKEDQRSRVRRSKTDHWGPL